MTKHTGQREQGGGGRDREVIDAREKRQGRERRDRGEEGGKEVGKNREGRDREGEIKTKTKRRGGVK